MSDLRTRIIAAMKERAERDTDWMLADLADAVIEALNLDVAVTYLSVDKLRREFCVEGQEGIRPMTDLRTRIAAVLGANSHMSRELQDHLADAVIRELDSHGWLIDPESGERNRRD